MGGFYAEALSALEHSGLGHFARHSAWGFTIANVLHVIGAALVLGSIAVFDVLVLARRGWIAAQAGHAAIPLAAFGLALQIPTGLVLLAAEAAALGQNPAFLAKLAFIALGILNLAWLHARFRGALRSEVPDGARAFALVSLVAWTATVAAGRMIAYL
jgi:hypothetical protein